ncbi:metal-dependent hydrolase (plasmid) [Halorarum halophilum]|uniref:Metal-dependent hydrolase n=1 Tax=Halorarum halophilum TaxID=2743090 RepID=A0A7D5K3K3_9EURY|nr:metal-dependent hydrolase [Halobaculum halophilum]QLG29741.1 metal-dependent hydrolase [Halobaculum halophilum]
MWPWEHLAFGYLLYSAWTHVAWRRSPRGAEALVLALATQFPDLVDKPLSWGLGLFPQGYAIGHSVLFAVPAAAVVAAVALRHDRPDVGVAFAAGYVSHLAADVLSPALKGQGLGFERVLWPFVTFEGYESDVGFAGRFTLYVGRYLHEVTQPEYLPFLLLYLGMLLAVVGLWVLDGAPGIRSLLGVLRSRSPDV